MKIKCEKTFGLANQWKVISAKISSPTVLLMYMQYCFVHALGYMEITKLILTVCI